MSLVIGPKLSGMTSHAWSSKSLIKIKTTSTLLCYLWFMRNWTVWASFKCKFIFCCFFMVLVQLMRFPFNRWNLPGENLSKYKNLNLAIELASISIVYSSRISVTAFLFGQTLCVQNAYFLIKNYLPQGSQIEFDVHTPFTPKTLQSWT